MSRLLDLIDEYKDTHGAPSDSSIARAIGVAPQTISSWRRRGIHQLPDRETLRALAHLLSVDYEDVVLRAVLIDIGWIEESDDGPEPTNLTDHLSKVAGEQELRVAKRPKKRE